MKITVLTENTTTNPNLSAEHGLSLYIEAGDKKILFDAGQSDLFAKNAEKLGIDLSLVDFAVLSHGHYDHGGGMKTFFEINQRAPLYMSKYAFEPHFNVKGKYNGLDKSLLESERIVFTDGTTELGNGITLDSCQDKPYKVELDSAGLFAEINGKQNPENFRHEHYLQIKENGKSVLISGCSHRGIINITEWFKPDILVGGFHFMNITDSELLKKYALALNEYNTAFYTCHCTGTEQYKQLKEHINNLEYISTGAFLELP